MKQISSILGLRNENLFIILIYLQTKKIVHKTKIVHFKFLHHGVFKSIIQYRIATHVNKIINIKENHQNINTIMFII